MKKLFFLLYAVFTYLMFFATFLYLVGFVSSSFVPKHIDSAPTMPLLQAMLIDAVLIAIFSIQHSVMARPAFKQWWTQFVPEPIERSTYVLFANLAMMLMFWQWQPLGGVIWQVESENIRMALIGISLLGFGIVFISSTLINHFDLFGLRQTWLYFTDKPYEPMPFRVRLFYRYVRHPLYLGFLIAFWSAPTMTSAHLFFTLLMTGYVFVAIQFEERDMTSYFGERYLEYKRSAAMIIPFTARKK